MSKDSLKNNNDEWLKAMKSSLENYQEPTRLSWDKLQTELEPAKAPVIPFFKRKGVVITSPVAAMLAILFSVSYIYNETGDIITEDNFYAQEADVKVDKEESYLLVNSEVDNAIKETINKSINKPVQASCAAIQNIVRSQSDSLQDISSDNDISPEEKNGEVVIVKSEKSPYYTDNLPGNESYTYSKPTVRLNNKRWSLALASSSSPEYSKSGTLDLSAIPASAWSRDIDDAIQIPDGKVVQFSDGLAYLSDYQYKHSQPVTFGLNVRKYLTNRFSLETGVSYTMLSSTLSDETKAIEKKQKMNYIVFPLKANYNFIDNTRLNFYVSAGASMAVCVNGTVDGKHLRDESLRFAGLASIGVEYRFIPGFGIYFEPGAAYNFDADSKVRTIYDDNPLNLTLNLGLRLTFK